MRTVMMWSNEKFSAITRRLAGTIVDLAKENRMLKSMQWEPMATAPKDETPFLAYYRALDTIYEVIWHPERGEWVCYDYEIDNFCQSDFTAWMPSPKHPVNPDRIRRDWNAS